MQKSQFWGCFKELKTSPLYASALSSDSISSHIYTLRLKHPNQIWRMTYPQAGQATPVAFRPGLVCSLAVSYGYF